MTNLDFLEETRLTVVVKNEVHRLKAIQYHNVKIKNKKFKFRDLILKKLKATSNQGSRGMLASKCDGPFKIIRVVKANTYHLQNMKGKTLPHLAF